MYWYVLNNKGHATLCADQTDAKKVAEESNRFYPMGAPHIAVLLEFPHKDFDVSIAVAAIKARV